MFETLKRLYKEGKLDIAGLSRAVGKGWISEAEYEAIAFESGESV